MFRSYLFRITNYGFSAYKTANISSTNVPKTYDIGIVGGGIIGLATGRELLIRHPGLRVVLLEKEDRLAQHQSGHNSGVIHAGIYYAPGSLKAKLCVEGLKRSYIYLDQHNIPYKKCGKLIVAVEEHELPVLDDLLSRATINGVPGVTMVPGSEIPSIEPHCKGLRALHSPNTGIVNWQQVALSYGDDFRKMGGEIWTSFEVVQFEESTENVDYPVRITGKQRIEPNSNFISSSIQCAYVITCAGLHSDRLARMTKCTDDPTIIPFRGDFLKLKDEYNYFVRGNIYPVPDPRFPFLGVHFTPRVDGSVWLGPNAVLSLKREGYSLTDFHPRDAWEILTYPGLQRIALKYFTVGMKELARAFIVSAQIKQLQRYIPQLRVEHVERGPSGVRAQALNRQGQLVDDFVLHTGETSIGKRVIHVRNAPSPAATSSLAIASLLVDRAEESFHISSSEKNDHRA